MTNFLTTGEPPHPTILKNEKQNPQTREKSQDPPSHFRVDVINV